MKWWNQPIDRLGLSPHLVSVMGRETRGLFIAHPGYTDAAITTAKELLNQRTYVMMTLEEIVMILDQDTDLAEAIRKRVDAVIAQKHPFPKV